MSDSLRSERTDALAIGGEDEQRLLALARRALHARVQRGPLPESPAGGMLDVRLGAFVSIRCRGSLRGCLGRLEGDAPLGDTVAHLAALLADGDPRFTAVTGTELCDIEIEISVLTPERQVQSHEEIAIGRHGVIVEQGRRRGLLLPQVAVEHGWDRQTLFEQACVKAGLPRGGWRHGVRLLVFEAHVFGDRAPLG